MSKLAVSSKEECAFSCFHSPTVGNVQETPFVFSMLKSYVCVYFDFYIVLTGNPVVLGLAFLSFIVHPKTLACVS